MSLTLKVQLRGELRKLRITEGITIEELKAKLSPLFFPSSSSSCPPPFSLRYQDEDGDLITLATTLELEELLSSHPPTSPPLYLQIFPSDLPPPSSPSLASPPSTPAPSTIPSQIFPSNPPPGSTGHDDLTPALSSLPSLSPPPAPSSLSPPPAPSSLLIDEETPAELPPSKGEPSSPFTPSFDSPPPPPLSPSPLESFLEGITTLGTQLQDLIQSPQVKEELERVSGHISSFFTSLGSLSTPPPLPGYVYAKEEENLQLLECMGFHDPSKNRLLLLRFGGNLERVVEELLTQN